MTYRAERFFDAFTFALGGVSVASSFGMMPIVASDRIARAWDARLRDVRSDSAAHRAPHSPAAISAPCAAGQGAA